MSVQAIGWALAQKVGSSSAKSVLVAIANYADENGQCWPSQGRIASDTELTDRSVRTAMALLEENGFINRVERRRPDGSRATDTISLIMQPEKSSAPPETASKKAETISPPPEGVSGLTTFEPSVNHQEPVARASAAMVDPIAKLKIDIVKAFSAAGSMTLVPDTHRAERWIAQGYRPDLIIATIRECLARKPHVTTLSYFDKPIAEAHTAKPASIARPMDPETEWRNKLTRWFEKNDWPGMWGDPPGHPCCKIPAAFIAAFNPSHLPRNEEAA